MLPECLRDFFRFILFFHVCFAFLYVCVSHVCLVSKEVVSPISHHQGGGETQTQALYKNKCS